MPRLLAAVVLLVVLAVLPAAEPCCPPGPGGVCVPQQEMKKFKHVYYSCQVEEYCQPKCPRFFLLRWCGLGCGDAGCPECQPEPYRRRKLVKTIVTEERPVWKCKVQTCAPEPQKAAPR